MIFDKVARQGDDCACFLDVCSCYPEVMRKMARRCTQRYSGSWEDTSHYDGSWMTPRDVTENVTTSPSTSSSAFTYRTAAELHTQDFWGYLGWYGGGGYTAILGDNPNEANDVITDLQRAGWVDEYARAIFIQLSIINTNRCENTIIYFSDSMFSISWREKIFTT